MSNTESGSRNVFVERTQSDQSLIYFWNEISGTDCIENDCIDCFVDCAWFCGCGMVYLYFLCFVMSYFVTLSLIRIEVSPFAVALISCILIYSQAVTLLLANDSVGVGIPRLSNLSPK